MGPNVLYAVPSADLLKARFGAGVALPRPEDSFPGVVQGVCEGVEKRSFLTARAIKPCGKKDRFSNYDGYVKRIASSRNECYFR